MTGSFALSIILFLAFSACIDLAGRLVFVSCIAAVYSPSKRIRDMAVTDTINEL